MSPPVRPASNGGRLEVLAPDGLGEVPAGADLATLLLGLLAGGADLVDGDVLVVTSKVVSKAEGRVADGTREQWLPAETVRVVARRGETTIARTRHGLTLAAAGIDASNVEPGRVVLLPLDPDASARALREQVLERCGRNLGVVVTDTAGRAWREGQTDIAVGAAGLVVLDDHAGRVDAHGNALAVTAPAVADEIAGAVELATGKLSARPAAVLRGRPDLVLPPGEHGAGAAALVRPEGGDLFGWGAREAVVRAVRGHAGDAGPFGAAVDAASLAEAIGRALGPRGLRCEVVDRDEVVCEPGEARDGTRDGARAVAFAHGWEVTEHRGSSDLLRFRPRVP